DVKCLYFLFTYSGLLYLCSFPTRRSSDLNVERGDNVFCGVAEVARLDALVGGTHVAFEQPSRHLVIELHQKAVEQKPDDRGRQRSEEHTSELQSRENLVCRLLLEKKKQKI